MPLSPWKGLSVTGSMLAAVSLVLRESGLHGGLLLRCELFATGGTTHRSAAGSANSPGG